MKSKAFSVVVMFVVTWMLASGCAHNELTAYDNNLDGLEQEALRAPDGKAFVRQGAKFNADVGGKHVGVIDAPADVTWEEVKKLMNDQQRLFRIYDNIPFVKSIDLVNSGGSSLSITYNAKVIFVGASVTVGFHVDERNHLITGNKTGGSFFTFVAKGAEHDIGVIPLDDNKSLLVVRFIGKAMFPASVGAGIGTSMIGFGKKITPKMTSAFIDEVRAGVRNHSRG